WQEELNAAGGLLGRRVELRFKDDGSEAVRAGEAYAELIRDGAQVLIGPYGSAATLTAAAEAERARRVLLNAAGPSSEIHKRQPQYVFQTLPPYAAYADGPLWAAREAAVDSLYIVARDDAASRDMAEAAQTQARALGFANVTLEIYSGRTEDFLPQLYKAMGANADGVVHAAVGRRAGRAEPVKLRSAVAALKIDTVLGPYRVGPGSGAQVGMKPAMLQVVKGRPQPIWPAAFAGERSLLRFET